MKLWVRVYWIIDKNPNSQLPKGTTLLYVILTYQVARVILQRVDHIGSVNIKDKDNRTPLSVAAANGHKDVNLLVNTAKADAHSKGKDG
ncbi:hypothetical protein B0I35DRAFT_365395 [Stachybotrys elegans]|uniref:Uncharacterized protein n=1 Tax=Stachybotrys elegans TaxID=80388 RepID=A0A8K0SGL2_9HYPO|nr:hypothetical protein B0I35DRAFT_365395 [Stachybotrys elegans]